MKLEAFFEKFDQFADAPDAVAKMREFVLNFAVTGRLSERMAGITAKALAPARRAVPSASQTASVPPVVEIPTTRVLGFNRLF